MNLRMDLVVFNKISIKKYFYKFLKISFLVFLDLVGVC